MHRMLLRLTPLVLGGALAVLLPVTASAGAGLGPAPPAGHDVTRPAEMAQAAQEVATANVGKTLQPRTAVIPLKPRARASVAAPALSREVFGFAKADSLADPGVGYTTWNFNLLTDVAYFGIHVNDDGTLANDSGLQIWQSSTASNFINTAHAAGVRVLLSLENFDQTEAGMCQALSSATTTINAVKPLLNGADGVDIDYEGVNASGCNGTDLQHQLLSFVQQVRAASLGYLVIDTYDGSAGSTHDFFDIKDLAGSVDAFFVMAYGLETSNHACSLCMEPTSPFDGTSPLYSPFNDTQAAQDYAPFASQAILGFPYYGVAGCVAPNPGPNAPVLSPSKYAGVPYTVFPTLGSNPLVSSYQQQRDAQDPNGQGAWATYNDADPTLQCWREAYFDDQTSLSHKFDLVKQRGFRGAGIFTLDYGGGSLELWNLLALEFAPSQFDSLGGWSTASPAVTSWASNRMDLFVRGSDNKLYHKFWNGSSWSDFENLGGQLFSAPAAVSWGPNRIDVFAQGGSDKLYHLWWDGSHWSQWELLDGIVVDTPGVASWGPNRLDLFVRSSDNGIWHRWWAGSGWSGWEPQGGQLTSGPGAVSWGVNRIDVFARGTDGALWHKWWDGGGWSGWEFRGGQLTAFDPAPASTAPGMLDVYIPGTDGGLWHQAWNGSTWSSFQLVGPELLWHDGPAAVSRSGSGRVDTFTIGPDNAVLHAAA